MPCYSDPDESGPIHLRLDRVTRAACNLAKVLRRGGTEADLDAETREWMADHDAWDARREAAEAAEAARKPLIESARAKLTSDELHALGFWHFAPVRRVAPHSDDPVLKASALAKLTQAETEALFGRR